MDTPRPVRIWYVGNWCIQLGETYVESPFKSEKKDVDLLNYAQPFVDALRIIPGAEVISQTSWELYHLSPEPFGERSRWATAIVEIRDQGEWHPLLASRSFGKGRVTAWTTGASPHRGINFMKWKQYTQLWKQVFAS
jgi:hypothetical protein